MKNKLRLSWKSFFVDELLITWEYEKNDSIIVKNWQRGI